MPKFEIQFECYVKAYVAVAIDAPDEKTARVLANAAARHLDGATVAMPDVVDKAIPKGDTWRIDHSDTTGWELEDVVCA